MPEIEYNYRTIEEIIAAIQVYRDFGVIDIIGILAITVFLIALVVYIFPGWKAIRLLKKTHFEKKKKKLALKQILIQKEVEEEIENELKLEAQQKMGK